MADKMKVALSDLKVGSVTVHHAGDKVSAEDVKNWNWDAFVADEGSADAKAAKPASDPGETAGSNPATAADPAKGAAKTTGA